MAQKKDGKLSKGINMQTKKFHLGEVLTVISFRLVTPDGFEGLSRILNFMTGENLYHHQLTRVWKECQTCLAQQYPQLTGVNMELAFAELDEAMNARMSYQELKKIIEDWLTKQVALYGEMFEVSQIPTEAHEVKDPLAELVEIKGAQGGVIVVKV